MLVDRNQINVQTFSATLVFIGLKTSSFGIFCYANNVHGSIHLIKICCDELICWTSGYDSIRSSISMFKATQTVTVNCHLCGVESITDRCLTYFGWEVTTIWQSHCVHLHFNIADDIHVQCALHIYSWSFPCTNSFAGIGHRIRDWLSRDGYFGIHQPIGWQFGAWCTCTHLF